MPLKRNISCWCPAQAASSLAEDGRGGVSDTGVVSTHNNVARGPSDGLLVDRTQFERGDGPAGSQRGDLAAALATEFADNGQRSPAVRPLSHAFSTPPLRETDLIFDSEAVATPSNRGGGRLSPLLSPRPRATRQPSSILSPRHGLVRNVSLPVAPSPPAAKPPLMPRPLDGIKESPNPKADTEVLLEEGLGCAPSALIRSASRTCCLRLQALLCWMHRRQRALPGDTSWQVR